MKSDNTDVKVDTKFKPGAEWRGNKNGRPKGSISILTDIKRKLEKLSKENPQEYEELIDYYIREPKMRELLIKMVDGMPRQSIQSDITMEGALGIFLDARRRLQKDSKPKDSGMEE